MQKSRTDSLNQGNADVLICFQSSVVDVEQLADDLSLQTGDAIWQEGHFL